MDLFSKIIFNSFICLFIYFFCFFSTLKVARVNMNVKDVVKNIIHSVYNTVPHLIKKKEGY